jgi:hypothetical protein
MTLPATADVRGGIRNWGMLGNDVNGDCVCAATEHLEMVHNLATTSSWKKLLYRLGFKPPSTKFTLELYTEFLATLGEKPPETGINPEQWFPWLLTKGIITEWQAVALDAPSVQQALIDWKGCLIALMLTDHAYQYTFTKEPWEMLPGDVPDPKNGHAVALVSYNQTDYGVVTWGRMKSMTNEFAAAYPAGCVYGCWVFK